MSKPKVAVVILNWNGRSFLEKFLPNIIKYSEPSAEVIIADNASTDSSVEFVQTHFPNIRLILNQLNYGFAQGYNEALSQVEADYYVLLNSDVEVTPNWLEPMIALLESDKQIAACQPKLLSYYERDKFEYAGAAGGFIDRLGYPYCRGRLFQNIEQDNGQYDNTEEIFWASGASMFVRADLYNELGGLDNDFFAHMEEIDLCWRLKNLGYKIMFCPESTIYHVGGGTLPKNSAKKTYLNFRNNLVLLYKNLPRRKLKRVFVARFVLDIVAALKFVADFCFKDFLAVFKAHWYFAKNKSYIKKKREKVQHNKVSKIYQGNIVWEHYFRKKKTFTDLENKYSE